VPVHVIFAEGLTVPEDHADESPIEWLPEHVDELRRVRSGVVRRDEMFLVCISEPDRTFVRSYARERIVEHPAHYGIERVGKRARVEHVCSSADPFAQSVMQSGELLIWQQREPFVHCSFIARSCASTG
jgi:hypothetical protein